MTRDDPRLDRQVAFLLEVDRLKGVLRRTRVLEGERYENSAEHSWHLALCALVLAEHAPPGVDVQRALTMALVHDLVEIDAGDTFCYDPAANVDRDARERLAAERLFGLLPGEQGVELRALWEEFEVGTSPDAAFAVAMDRLQPLLLNFQSAGGSWREHAVTQDRVLTRMLPIREGAPTVWPLVLDLLDEAVRRGFLAPAPASV